MYSLKYNVFNLFYENIFILVIQFISIWIGIYKYDMFFRSVSFYIYKRKIKLYFKSFFLEEQYIDIRYWGIVLQVNRMQFYGMLDNKILLFGIYCYMDIVLFEMWLILKQ